MNSRFFEEPREGPGTRTLRPTGASRRGGDVHSGFGAGGPGFERFKFKVSCRGGCPAGPRRVTGTQTRNPRVGTARDPEFPPESGNGPIPDSRFPIPGQSGNREWGERELGIFGSAGALQWTSLTH